MSTEDILTFNKNYEDIKDHKWILESRRAVEDVIFEKVKAFNYEQ